MNLVFDSIFREFLDDGFEKIHKIADFFITAIPIFSGESPDGDSFNAGITGDLGELLETVKSATVTFESGKSSFPCPTAVTVGDDGDVLGDGFIFRQKKTFAKIREGDDLVG